MAIIAQRQLFGWNQIDELGDLARLRLVLEHLPDEELMRALEARRRGGRDDYPIRAMWNSLLAGVVFDHASIESLRRELKRNGQLRALCGFDVVKGAAAVPSRWAYTRFLKTLMRHQPLVDRMFDRLVEELGELLEGFGARLGCDGKLLRSHGRRRSADAPSEPDGRRDLDADVGVKTYRGVREDGTLWEKVKTWFGYTLHLVVDTEYELPVAYKVTRASAGEQPVAQQLLDTLDARHPSLLERCSHFTGDKGYDDGKLTGRLWDDYGIKPVIDIRDLWKDEGIDLTRPLEGGPLEVVYDYRGTLYCHCPLTDRTHQMAYGGFERERGTLKYLCPARHYGFECPGMAHCSIGHSLRVPLSDDRRRFTPLPRATYSWRREYNKRTAIERVNSRLDVSFGLERHFIRGLDKMKLRCSLALCVMLAMALGRARENQHEHIRSLVRAA